MVEASDQQGGEGVSTAIVPTGPAAATLFGTDDPRVIVALATKQADALAQVVKAKNLVASIQGRDHVRVEGWTMLGTFLGVYPVETFTRAIPEDWRERGMERPEGYEARVEARTRDGAVVGAANARCLFDEESGRERKKQWSDKPDYALASMAQTRAVSKALRMPLGFVVVLAGFEATPSEEVEGYDFEPGDRRAEPETRKRSTRKASTPAEPTDAKPAGSDQLRDLWKEATALLGSRAEVVKWLRDEFGLKGTVTVGDVTEDQLRQVIGVAREAKGAA